MIHRQLQVFKRSYHGSLRMALGLLTAICITGSFGAPTANAAITDCSDVFTPLSQFVQDGVAANKAFYIRAMNETGVPWELLAAIHYRETSFSHSNPSNGQGIFQFVNGDGGPYTPGPVSDDNFYAQLRYMAKRIQSDYALRNASPSAAVTPRALTANEQDINLIKNTLFSYNGRSSLYAQQASQYGFSTSSQPYEGSPYVMNRFDCQRARMGIITKDYGTIDSVDTRYGAFTIFARLRGDNYWLAMTMAYSWLVYSQAVYYDPSFNRPVDTSLMSPNTTYYMRVQARNIGSSTWSRNDPNPVLLATTAPSNRDSSLCNASWVNCRRAALLKESSVAPGEIGTFEFSVTTPSSITSYSERFNLVAEGKSWFNDIGMYQPIVVSAPTERWSTRSQTVYLDAERTKQADTSNLAPNTTYYARVTALNTGNTRWQNSGSNPLNFATYAPQDRSSAVYDASWLSSNRSSRLNEAIVEPGEVGTFDMKLRTPGSYGTYKEYFRPVLEGKTWLNDVGFYWLLTVNPPTPQWSIVSQTVYSSSTRAETIDAAKVANRTRVFVSIKALNTGNTTWKNSGPNPTNLGTSSPSDRTSQFYDSSWLGPNRPAALKEASVAPGETGTFEFWVTTPFATNGTSFKEYFRAVTEGSAWMNDIGMYQPFTLSTPTDAWQYVSQAAYVDSGHTTLADLTNASKNTTYYLVLKAKNTGGATWKNSGPNPTNLGTSSPSDRTSQFYDSSWLGPNRPAALKEASVAPGETGTFEFSIKTPSLGVTSKEYFRPVTDGVNWLVDCGLYWQITVK